MCLTHKTTGYLNVRFFLVLINIFGCFLSGHAHLTDFNIATIIKDGERATALAGTKPYMGNFALQAASRPSSQPRLVSSCLIANKYSYGTKKRGGICYI